MCLKCWVTYLTAGSGTNTVLIKEIVHIKMKFCHHLLTLILISRVLKPLTSESSFRILCQLNSITTTGPAPAYKNLFSWKMNNLHGDQGNMVLFCKSTLSVEYSALPLWDFMNSDLCADCSFEPVLIRSNWFTKHLWITWQYELMFES